MVEQIRLKAVLFVVRLRGEDGQALVEYALILALVSIVSIVVLGVLGVDIRDLFTTVETKLDSKAGG
jgi:Flp pilus assembly pilin Flp